LIRNTHRTRRTAVGLISEVLQCSVGRYQGSLLPWYRNNTNTAVTINNPFSEDLRAKTTLLTG